MNLKELGKLSLSAFFQQLRACKNIAGDLFKMKKKADQAGPSEFSERQKWKHDNFNKHYSSKRPSFQIGTDDENEEHFN